MIEESDKLEIENNKKYIERQLEVELEMIDRILADKSKDLAVVPKSGKK